MTRGLILAALLCAPLAPAAEGDAPKAEEDAFAIKLNGAVGIWGLMQRNFFLGKDHPLNDADYVVQNVRLNLQVGTPKVGGVVRADLGQGWWGTDNSPNQVTTTDDQGNTTAGYNGDAMFGNKDTNYGVHVDHAYLFFELPWAPLRLTVGRQPMPMGNMLVLDGEQDALQVTGRIGQAFAVDAFWGKFSEGQGSYKAPRGALMNDDDQWADADLFGGKVRYKKGDYAAELFGLFYKDHTDTDKYPYAYLPQGLGYGYARYQAQISQAVALGITASGKAKVGAGLSWLAEFDYLFGKDDVENADHAGGLLDRYNVDLAGFNALLKLTQALDIGMPFDITVLAGMGSGDDDPTDGKGNINRIQTAGYWPLTNVWEDSVMPDVGGITPQGLGSPASRGYRELENTTAAQLGLGLVPWTPLRLELSYTYLKATQDVHGWDPATGAPTDETSGDLGQEIDFNLKFTILPGLKYIALFGYFMPGDASALLINGNTTDTDAAWELKQVLVYAF